MKTRERKIRKNILLSESINQELKEMANFYKKSQSKLIEELLQEKIAEFKKQKRLEAFQRIIERANKFAGITENKTIQEIKEEMGNEI